MSNLKKGLTAVVCLVMVLALCACSMVTVNEDKDNAQVIAEVNGVQLQKILYKNMLDNMLYNYGMTQEDMKSSENADSMRQDALKQVVDQELLFQAAREAGMVDESEENRATIKAEIEADIESTRSYFKDSVAASEAADPDAEAQKLYEDYVKASGYGDIEKAVDSKIRGNAIQQMYDQIMAEVTYTDEQAKEYFDQQVEIQQPLIEEDKTNFTLYNMYEQAYVNPAGSKYVKNLLLGIPEEKQSEIAALRQSGKETDANVLRDEELAKIKVDADAALQRVQDGEDFDLLLEEIGIDPGMTQDPAKTYGYLVYENSNFVDEFEAAALAIPNVGDATKLVPSDFGYHIIKYLKDAAGPVEFDMVKENIIASQTSAKQSSHYTEYIDGVKETAAVKTYENRLK